MSEAIVDSSKGNLFQQFMIMEGIKGFSLSVLRKKNFYGIMTSFKRFKLSLKYQLFLMVAS